jgi:hypothetical protein
MKAKGVWLGMPQRVQVVFRRRTLHMGIEHILELDARFRLRNE